MELGRFLTRRVSAGELAAGEAAVSVAGRRVARARAGSLCWNADVPLGGGELYDAASLTKPFVATLALVLDQAGVLPLSTRISDVLPAARPALGDRTAEDLLRHRSGLKAWFPLEALELPGKLHAALLGWFGARAPLGAPPGTYSDLGFILWTLLAEAATGARLADLLLAEVISPLGLRLGREVGEPSSTGPIRQGPVRPGVPKGIVECGLDGEREVELAAELGIRILRRADARWRGEPQDGNARFLGGVPGHAGLFVTVEALLVLGHEWLAPGTVLRPESVRRALAGPAGRHALGWARRRRSGSAGAALSRSAYGHTGFTGGSLWIDPERGLIAALVAYRRTSALDLGPLRRSFHRLAVHLASPGRPPAGAARDLR